VSDILKNLIKQFMPFAQKHIGFEKPPRLFLKQDPTNAKDPLGKTAYYDPAEMSVTLYTTDRHPKDILRSLGHELVHHKQNCEGKFDDVGEMGEGYAQTNPHLRQMEVEANRDGSMCLRDFTDTLMRENTIYFEHLQKGDTNMSTKDWKNGELKGLLTEAWGFQMDLSKLNEGEMPMKSDTEDADGDGDTEDEVPAFLKKEGAACEDDAEVVDEQSKSDLPDRGGNRSQGGRRLDEEDEEDVKEEFPGEGDMNTHKRDLSEARLKEIIAYALKTKG
jgi:hypothetical protein